MRRKSTLVGKTRHSLLEWGTMLAHPPGFGQRRTAEPETLDAAPTDNAMFRPSIFLMLANFALTHLRPIPVRCGRLVTGWPMSLAALAGIFCGLSLSTIRAADWPVARAEPGCSGSVPTELPADLKPLWKTKVNEAIEATPVTGLGSVVVVDVFGGVYALQLSDGTKRWERQLDTGFQAAAAISAGGDGRDARVYLGDVEGNLSALSLDTGETVWTYATEGMIYGGPTFYDDTVLATSQDGNLYAVGIEDGQLRWQYETGDQLRCAATIADDVTFLGGCDAKLHRVRLDDGQSAGDPVEVDGPTGSTPAMHDGIVTVPIMSGVVYGFDAKTSEVLWRYEDDQSNQEFHTDAAVRDGIAVVVGSSKSVDAIDVQTGKRLWRYTLKRRSQASPIIAGEDVWIASADGRLIRLGLRDGAEKWSYEIRGSFLASPAIAGDRLLVADDDGNVHCFGP